VKDKAKLFYELETVSKLNADLTDQVKSLHSQLEQEKSRYNGLLADYRRLSEVMFFQKISNNLI